MRTLTAEAAEGLIVNIVNVKVVMVDAGTLSRVSLFCQLDSKLLCAPRTTTMYGEVGNKLVHVLPMELAETR